MTKGILKRFGLCLALALLLAALWGASALADDPRLEGLDIRLSSATVVPTDEVDIYYESAWPSDNGTADIAYTLRIEGVTNGEESIDVSGIIADHRCFTVPAAGLLTPGHAYRAVITAEADGYEGQEASALFLVSKTDNRFRVRLWVNGQDSGEMDMPVTEWVSIDINAQGAEEVIFGNGHEFEESAFDFGFRPDEFGNIHIDYFWDYERRATVYARARFHDPYTDEDVWVTSDAVTVNTYVEEGHDPLPAPQLTLSDDSISRGEILAVTANQVPQGAERLVLQVWTGDDCRFEEEYWPNDEGNLVAELPTAQLPEGEYRLNAWWRGVGYVSENDDTSFTFTVEEADDQQPFINSMATSVVPHERFTLYGCFPGAGGVCLYEGWEIRFERMGQDGIYWIDAHGEIGSHTYYLGVWNGDTQSWERTDKSVTVTVRDPEKRLHDPNVDFGPTDDGVLGRYELDGEDPKLYLTIYALENTADYNQDDLWYDLYVTDTTDGHEVLDERGMRLYSSEEETEEDPTSSRTFDIPFGWLEEGHTYTIRAYVGCYGYPMQLRERQFVVLPEYYNSNLHLEIEGNNLSTEEGGQLTVAPNADNVITVRLDDYDRINAVQVFWDGGWQNVDPNAYDEEANVWRWSWSLDNPGEQMIVARATDDSVDWDDMDWNDIYWYYYSEAQFVTVNDGTQVGLPTVELSDRQLQRGDVVSVNVGPAPEHVRAYSVDVFSMNEWGDYWDHEDGDHRELNPDELENGTSFEFCTGGFAPGTYRVNLNAIAEPGFTNNETDYNQPDLYFTVDDYDTDAGLIVSGFGVEGENGSYTVPVHRRFYVSGHFAGARALRLYKNGEPEDEWWDTDGFSWESSSGHAEEQTYTLSVWNDEKDDWGDPLEGIEAKVNITAASGKLGDPEITCDPTFVLEDDSDPGEEGDEPRVFTFSFKEVENAGWYFIHINQKDDWGNCPYDADIPAFEEYDPDAVHEITLENTDDFEPGREYVICVNSFQEDYDGGYAEKSFHVLPSVDGNISLALDDMDGNDEQDSFLVNRNARFTLNAPGCTYAEVYWNHNWEGVDVYHWRDEEDDPVTWEWRTDQPGPQHIVARVTYDEDFSEDTDWGRIDWEYVNWNYTDGVSVDFQTVNDEPLPLPEITLDKGELTRGETLKVTLGEPDSETSAHADHYNIHIFDAEGDQRWEDRYFTEADIAAASIDLPTMQLWPGVYRVHVDIDAHEGYFADITDENDRDLWFTVKDIENPVATIYATKPGDNTKYTGNSKMSVFTLTDYSITGFVPGAERVAIFHHDGDADGDEGELVAESDGEGIVYFDFWPFTGTHAYTLSQWNNYSEDWERVTGLKAVAVAKKKSGGKDLAPCVIEGVPEESETGPVAVPASVVCGEEFKFIVKSGDSFTERVFVNVYRDDDWNDHPVREWPSVSGPDDPKEFSIQTKDLMPGGLYVITAQAQGAGHQANDEARATFMVTGSEQDENLSIELFEEDGGDTPETFVASKGYRAHIHIDNYDEDENFIAPTFVELFWGDGWRRLWLDDNNPNQTSFGDYDYFDSFGSGPQLVQFRASWDNVNEDEIDWEHFDWNRDLDWHYSNAIALDVTSSGRVQVPTIALSGLDENGGIDMGGTLTVKLSNIRATRAHVAEYHININRLRDGEQYYWEEVALPGATADNKTITIDLQGFDHNGYDHLDPGEYRVHVHVQAEEGWDSNWTDGDDESLWFTVNNVLGLQSWVSWDEENGDSWSELANEITTVPSRDYIVHAETDPGVRYCFYCGDEREDEWGCDDSNGVCDMHRSQARAGDYTYYLGFQDDEGVWHRMDWTAMTVHVEAAEGNDLAAPEIISYPVSLNPDESFTFEFQGVDNLVPDGDDGEYGVYHIEVRDEDGWRPIFDSDYYFDPNREGDNPESIVYNSDDGTYTVTVTPPYYIYEYNEETEEDEVVETNHVLPGHQYIIKVSAHRPGWNSGDAERGVMCMGGSEYPDGQADRISLTVNGQTEGPNGPIMLNANDEVDLHIEVPNRRITDEFDETEEYTPSRVEIFWRNEWVPLNQDSLGEGFDGDFTDLSFTWDVSGRNFTAVVRATWDYDDYNWIYSNPVALDITRYGQVGMPEITLSLNDEHKVRRGEPLEIAFGPKPEHVREYHVRINWFDGNEGFEQRFFNVYDVSDETISLPTDFLDEYNDYAVSVYAYGESGWEGNGTSDLDTSLRFRVVPGGVNFFADKTEVRTGEPVILSAYVPGAHRLGIQCVENDYDIRENGGGDNQWEEYRFEQVGDYTFRLLQWNGDDWSDDREYIGEPIVVHVTADGDLAKPVIDAPETLLANGQNDLVFTVTVDGKAERANVSVWSTWDEWYVHGDDDDNYESYHYEDEWEEDLKSWTVDPETGTKSRSFTIPKEDLRPGIIYSIDTYTWATGWTASYASINVYAAPEETAGSPVLCMEVNGSTAAQTFACNQDYQIRFWMELPEGIDASPIEYQLMWDGWWDRVTPGESFDGDWMGGVFNRSDGEDNRRTLVMRARFEEEGEWIYSNAVQVNTYTEGELPRPTVQITNLDENGAIARGEKLNVAIDIPNVNRPVLDEEGNPVLDGQGNPTFGPVDAHKFVDNIEVALCRYWNDDGYEDSFELRLNGNATTAELPTVTLEPGRYFVKIWINGRPGWVSNCNRYDDEEEGTFFTIADSDTAQQPILQAELTEVPTFTFFKLVGYVPGADQVALFCDGEYWEREDGDTIDREDVWSNRGTHTYQLAVWSESLDDWRILDLESCTVEVSVTSKGDLAAPVISGFSGAYTRGEDFSFDIEVPKDTPPQWYRVHVSRQDDGEDQLYHEDYCDVRRADENGKIHITVPAGEFERFMTGERFEINVQANANNYDSAETRLSFTMLAPVDPEVESPVVLGFTNLPDSSEVLVNQTLKATLTSTLQDPTMAQIYWDGDWCDLWPWDISGGYNDGQFNWSLGRPGQQSLVARVTTDNLDDIDWDEINWTYSSPVNVTVLSAGEMPDITATLSTDALRSGENLTVSIQVGEDDDRSAVDHFDVTVYGSNDDGFWRECQRMHFTGDTTLAIVPTSSLDVDTYRVQVHAFGKPGYEDKETDNSAPELFFRVKPAIDTKLSFTVTETEVPVLYTYAVSAYVPGAERVQLFENGNAWIHWDDEGEHDSWYGNRLTAEVRQDRGGKYRYTLKAYDQDDNEMELEYDPITVTVSTLGKLADAPVAYDATPSVDEAFTFTVSPVDNGAIYYIRVVYDDTGDPILEYEGNLAEEGPYTGIIPAGTLEAGRNYRIEVHVAAEQWTATDKSHPFTPVAADAKTLRLTLEGAGEPDEHDVYTIQSQQQVTFCVTADGELNNVQLAWESWMGTFIDMEAQENGSWTVTVGDESGSRNVYAKAILDGNEVVSNSISLNVIGESTDPPAASLNTHAGRMLDDETLVVTIEPDWARVSTYNVTIFGTTADTMDRPFTDPIRLTEDDGVNTVSFDLADLLEADAIDWNVEYRVQVDAWGKEGYDSNWTDSGDESLYFTIIDPLGILDFELEPTPETLMLAGEKVSLNLPALAHADPNGAYWVHIASDDTVLVDAAVPSGPYTAPAFQRDGNYTVTVTSLGEWGYKSEIRSAAVRVISADTPRLKLPAAITEIAVNVFRGNEKLRIVDLRGATSLRIGEGAFADCANLALVLLPDSGVSFGNWCFDNDEGVVFCCAAGSETYQGLRDLGYTDESIRTTPILLFN